ncbi:MAG: SET domain-containing protein-lysine N-methyltransferase [Anaerolineae bacterium]|nr:SET domain-containing protein-lysine N-methyltransferase [Anaerolineae bacterium]
MADALSSYLSPALEAREVEGKGYGIFALQPIQKGDLIAAWGGSVYTQADFTHLDETLRSLSVQIAEGLFLVPEKIGPGDRINHCCNPNAGILGYSILVAMRDIVPGEEVCYDYAMTDGDAYDEFTCACGAPDCRKHISGNDWRNPELWTRYEGYFSIYLQQRIERLKQLQAES